MAVIIYLVMVTGTGWRSSTSQLYEDEHTHINTSFSSSTTCNIMRVKCVLIC